MLKQFKYLPALLFLWLLFSIHIDGNTQQKYYHLLEIKKYNKLEKKAAKDLSKVPVTDTYHQMMLNHLHALLFSSRDFKKYNIHKAYEYILVTLRLYANISDQKKIEKLQKKQINNSSLVNDLQAICQKALDDVIEKNTIKNYQLYIDTYKRASLDLIYIAKTKRNALAFKEALSINTVESFQNFITTYPDAKEVSKAISNRNQLAYKKAEQINTIGSYQTFINTYPDAIEIPKAIEKRDRLAFEKAKQENTAAAYKNFMDKYPTSIDYNTANKLYETRLFEENTIMGDYKSYQDFILNFPENSMVSNSIDSLIKIGNELRLLDPLKFATQNSTGISYNKAVLAYYNLFTSDGELRTLYEFEEEFYEFEFHNMYDRDIEIALQGNQLNLEQPFDPSWKNEYLDYIKVAAPKEKAFVALQRIISIDIKNKKWSNAIKSIKEVKQFFGEDDQRIINLIELLEAKWDKSIVVKSVGSGINTKEGGEYVPVISADNKYLFFCGRDRNDNIGGEDVFVSRRKGSSWKKAKLVSSISNSYANDAPLSISTDGTSLVFFRNGEIYMADKEIEGWGNSREMDGDINTGSWSAGAMFSSDGKALIFTSVREENYNYYTDNQYHGENYYPADIYVCLKNEYNEWGDAINLGPTINTIYCDRSPFLHPDMKTLYFSSDGHGGLGGLDVFKSTRLADTCWDCWSEPVNMGKEINTTGTDWGYRISTNGKKAYFAVRKLSEKTNDIYNLNLPPHLRPDYVATISGKLLDKDGAPVAANIKWEDLSTGKNVGVSKSDPTDGSYFIVLPLGKIYGYYVEENKYFPLSNNLDLRDSEESTTVEENIAMVTFEQMINDGIAVPVNNLFFEYNKYVLLDYSIPELKRVAKIIIENKLHTEINGHTDNIGDDAFNMELSINRANAVKEFLINQGVDSAILKIVGHGENNPVESNDTEKGRAKNRRVEINFIKP